MPDRVKQSIFDRLWSRGALESEAVLDVFAGSGSLGIEALSRGITHCTFVERDRTARGVIQKNLDTLGLADRATLLGVDALASGWVGLVAEGTVGLVFCDPPYKLTADEAGMQRVAGLIGALTRVVAQGATLLLRTDDHTQAPVVAGWDGPESQRYGSTVVHGYGR